MVIKQSDLWLALSDPDFLNKAESDARIKSSRLMRGEALYDKLCERFAETLPEKQRAAFNGILSISESIQCDRYEQGVALGFALARELENLLTAPITAMQQATESYLPFEQSEAHSLRAIRAYLDENEK